MAKLFRESVEELKQRIWAEVRNACADFTKETGVTVCAVDLPFLEVTTHSSSTVREFELGRVNVSLDL